MTPAEAAWVRENAWTQAMRLTHSTVPRAAGTCDCQAGLTWHCQEGAHGRCHRAEPLASWEACITRPDTTVVEFTAPYRHPSPSATGWHRVHDAQVWLADRTCRWVCPCECHAGPEPVQLDLFE